MDENPIFKERLFPRTIANPPQAFPEFRGNLPAYSFLLNLMYQPAVTNPYFEVLNIQFETRHAFLFTTSLGCLMRKLSGAIYNRIFLLTQNGLVNRYVLLEEIFQLQKVIEILFQSSVLVQEIYSLWDATRVLKNRGSFSAALDIKGLESKVLLEEKKRNKSFPKLYKRFKKVFETFGFFAELAISYSLNGRLPIKTNENNDPSLVLGFTQDEIKSLYASFPFSPEKRFEHFINALEECPQNNYRNLTVIDFANLMRGRVYDFDAGLDCKGFESRGCIWDSDASIVLERNEVLESERDANNSFLKLDIISRIPRGFSNYFCTEYVKYNRILFENVNLGQKSAEEIHKELFKPACSIIDGKLYLSPKLQANSLDYAALLLMDSLRQQINTKKGLYCPFEDNSCSLCDSGGKLGARYLFQALWNELRDTLHWKRKLICLK